MQLLTEARVIALSQINRFNGWTKRPYSVLEHTVIGAAALDRAGYEKQTVRAFLLHDMEETVFGDLITPVKRAYMAPNYARDVALWEKALCLETGVSMVDLHDPLIKAVDATMLAVEASIVYTARDDSWSAPMPLFPGVDVNFVRTLVRNGRYSGTNAVGRFWFLWGRKA